MCVYRHDIEAGDAISWSCRLRSSFITWELGGDGGLCISLTSLIIWFIIIGSGLGASAGSSWESIGFISTGSTKGFAFKAA